MKTSLEIDDRLYKAARLRAARENTTVRALVERGLQSVLGLGSDPAPAQGPAAQRELDELAALCAQVSALPLLSQESADAILGYDDAGGFE